MAPSKSLSWTIALLLLPSHISSQGFCGLLYLTNSCLYRIQNLGLKEELGGSQIMRVETEIKFWVCYSSQHKLYWHDYHLNIFKIISVCNSIQAQLISLAHLLSEHRCTLGKEGWENTTCFQCLRYPLCWIGPIAWDATPCLGSCIMVVFHLRRVCISQLEGSGVLREVTMRGGSIPFTWDGVGHFLLLIPARPMARWCHLDEVRRLEPAICSGDSKTRSSCERSDLS